jgi:hypothetical protein
MAYQFRPGQKIQYIGQTNSTSTVRQGDIGEFAFYGPPTDNEADRFLYFLANPIALRKGYCIVYTLFHGKRFVCGSHEIRPVDDGAQPGSFDECVWKPEEEEETT